MSWCLLHPVPLWSSRQKLWRVRIKMHWPRLTFIFAVLVCHSHFLAKREEQHLESLNPLENMQPGPPWGKGSRSQREPGLASYQAVVLPGRYQTCSDVNSYLTEVSTLALNGNTVTGYLTGYSQFQHAHHSRWSPVVGKRCPCRVCKPSCTPASPENVCNQQRLPSDPWKLFFVIALKCSHGHGTF